MGITLATRLPNGRSQLLDVMAIDPLYQLLRTRHELDSSARVFATATNSLNKAAVPESEISMAVSTASNSITPPSRQPRSRHDILTGHLSQNDEDGGDSVHQIQSIRETRLRPLRAHVTGRNASPTWPQPTDTTSAYAASPPVRDRPSRTKFPGVQIARPEGI